MNLVNYMKNEIKTIENITSQQLLNSIKSLQMKREEDYNTVSNLYSEARKYKTLIESWKKEAKRPYREQILAIDNEAQQYLDLCDQSILLCNQQIGVYQSNLREQARLLEEAKAIFLKEKPIPVVIETIKPKKTEKTTTVIKKVPVYKVLDIKKVPKKYLQINEAVLKKDLNLGIREIKGLEITEEEQIQLRNR